MRKKLYFTLIAVILMFTVLNDGGNLFGDKPILEATQNNEHNYSYEHNGHVSESNLGNVAIFDCNNLMNINIRREIEYTEARCCWIYRLIFFEFRTKNQY